MTVSAPETNPVKQFIIDAMTERGWSWTDVVGIAIDEISTYSENFGPDEFNYVEVNQIFDVTVSATKKVGPDTAPTIRADYGDGGTYQVSETITFTTERMEEFERFRAAITQAMNAAVTG